MPPSSRDKFTIAIICALVLEADAIEAHFDDIYDRFGDHYGQHEMDRNCYLNGRIGKHEVVLCYMPGMGKGSAAMVASDLRFSYINIEMALVVGICGAVPKLTNGQPLFLGDAIIGDSVIMYDFGKQYPNGFRRKRDVKDTFGRPSHKLRTLFSGLSASQARREFQGKMAIHLQKVQQADSKWHRPQFDDILFDSSHPHKHHIKADSPNCACSLGNASDLICEEALNKDCTSLGCDNYPVSRRRQQTEICNSAVHIGPIASADTVMKSGSHRDKIAEAEGIIAFEMEGAGVWDNSPCVIIKGVCDYADSHKDSKWQLYAAANGAAAAKTFLGYVTPGAETVSPIDKIDKQIQWMVPFRRNPKFVGRRNQIEQLRARLSGPNGSRELAITGLGGVGKTQVALELAYQIRDADPDCSILWIPCTSRASVEQAYTELARRLGLPGQTDAKTEVQTYLSQPASKKWILIFDNADSEHMWMKDNSALRAFVPDSEQGRTLFTSRNGQLAIDLADSNIIKVDEFDVETGKEFLRQSLMQQGLLKDHNTVVRFLEKLTFLPLAITQAVAYINKNQITLPTYIGLLEKQESDIIEVLSENFQDKWRYKDVQNPVATTWWISFQQIQQLNPLAAEYLSFMACINPRDIPQSVLPPATSENEKVKAIGLLKSYAFVTNSNPAEHKLLSLHRLVHVATRNWMRTKKTLEPQILRTIDELGATFLAHLSQNIGHSTTLLDLISYKDTLCRQHMPHILTVLREECVLSEQIKYSEFIAAVSIYLMMDRRFKEAEDLLTQFIENSYMQEGLDNINMFIVTVDILTTIYGVQKRTQESGEVLRKFLDRGTTISLQNRVSMQFRALSSTEYGRDERAQGFGSTVLENPEPEVLADLEIQHGLATLYKRIERYPESENLYLESIRNSQNILGQAHPRTLAYQANLAVMYCGLQQHRKAEELYLNIIRISKDAPGQNRSASLVYQSALAILYDSTGRYAEAEQICLQLIEMTKAIHRPDSMRTLGYQFLIALIYTHQKRYEEAEEMMIHVIETRKPLQGSKGSWTMAQEMSMLVYLYIDCEDIHKAEEALMQLVEYWERYPESPGFDIGTRISRTQKFLHMKKLHMRVDSLLKDNKVSNRSSAEQSVTKSQTDDAFESSHSA